MKVRSFVILLIVFALFALPVFAQEVTPEAPPVAVVTDESPVTVIIEQPADPPVESGVPNTLFLVVVVVLALVPLIDKYITRGQGKEMVAQLGASAPKWVTDAMFNLASERIEAGKVRAALTPEPLDDVSVQELEQQVLELRRLIDAKRAGGMPASAGYSGLEVRKPPNASGG